MLSLFLTLSVVIILLLKSTTIGEGQQACPLPLPGLRPSPQPPPSDFSHFTLSLQWPYTTCYHIESLPPTQNCQLPPATFTISSFWPSCSLPQTSPTCCKSNNNHSFSLSPILDLTPTLRRFWPSLYKTFENDEDEWKFNWQRYGACSQLTERIYFRKVLQLCRLYDLIRVLKSYGINVSATRKYSVDVVYKAAKNTVGGYNVRLLCINHGDDSFYLHELHICFHKFDYHIINCPDLNAISNADYDLHVSKSYSQTPCHLSSSSLLFIPYGSSNNSNSDNTNTNTNTNNSNTTDNSNATDNGNDNLNNFNNSTSNNGKDDMENMTTMDSILYILCSLIIFLVIAFCIFYKFRSTIIRSSFTLQYHRSHHQSRPSRIYYHPIHTSTSNTNP